MVGSGRAVSDLIEWFKSGGNGKEYLMKALSVIIILTVVSATFYVLLMDRSDKFTEFYVLNSQGHAYDYPINMTVGMPDSIIIGVKNHEGRQVNYTVEAWLVDYTFEDMIVNVSQMYFAGSFNMVLNNTRYNNNDPWTKQWEMPLELNFTSSGNFTLFLMLFEENTLPRPDPIDTTTNYSTDPDVTWRIVMCVNSEIQYLRLAMNVADVFTEFYVQDAQGGSIDQMVLESGVAEIITIGIANHELRRINYAIEVWLVNYTSPNMAVNVTEMYFVGLFDVTLNHTTFNENNWTPQFETLMGLNLTMPGNYTLFLMLFADETEQLPDPIDNTTNYATTPYVSWRVVMCVNSEIQYLTVDVQVTP